MESRPQLLILASLPEALTELCGVSLLERLLRTAQRLGFHEATILTDSTSVVGDHIAKPSWARADLALHLHSLGELTELIIDYPHTLIVSADFSYDARLLKTMAARKRPALLIDSGMKDRTFAPTALLDHNWGSRFEDLDQLIGEAAAGRIDVVDAASEPTYLADLRRHIRPVFIPASRKEEAESFIRDSAQNGTLDFPALVHAPIETWMVSKLCRTTIRPNQITFATLIAGFGVTLLFATGHLWLGTFLALIVGVLDGVDGKLARTKIETTPVGAWEHSLDYFVELSWWTALAVDFQAYWPLGCLIVSDLCDRLAKRSVKRRLGRNLDDVSGFDRFVRLIGGRRNIYIWLFTIGLTLRQPRNTFLLICLWGGATAAVHLGRSLRIWSQRVTD